MLCLFEYQAVMSSSSETVMVAAAPETRRVNETYRVLRDRVQEMAGQLRAEYDAGGDLREHLMKGNQGVRCFMKWQDLLGSSSSTQASEFYRPGVPCEVYVSTDLCVNVVQDHELPPKTTMMALYVPNTARSGEAPLANPLGLIYGGLPSELTELAICSTLLWHLKAPALMLSETRELCQLHATTSFYLPSVEVRRDSFMTDYEVLSQPFKTSLMLTADVNCVLDFWAHEHRESVKTSHLIRNKLLMPFHMALRQNVNRQKLGLPLIRNLVLGDMNIPHREPGINSLFARLVKEVMHQYDGFFDHVVVCGPLATTIHLQTFLQNT